MGERRSSERSDTGSLLGAKRAPKQSRSRLPPQTKTAAARAACGGGQIQRGVARSGRQLSDVLRHIDLADRSGVGSEPELARRLVVGHVANRVSLRAVAEDRNVRDPGLRFGVESVEFIRLYTHVDEPDAILIVLCGWYLYGKTNVVEYFRGNPRGASGVFSADEGDRKHE